MSDYCGHSCCKEGRSEAIRAQREEQLTLWQVEASLMLRDWLVASYSEEKPIHKLMTETCGFLGHPGNGLYCFCGEKLDVKESDIVAKSESKVFVPSRESEDRFREEQRELYQKWKEAQL